jgi:hypothetical protein
MTEHTWNQIFSRDIQKIYFQNLHLGPIRWVLKRFFKIWIFYSQNLHFNLGFLSNFQKLLHAHPEHTRKRFYRTLSMRRTNFRVCSSSGKILTVFTCTAMLSIQGNDFIAP